MEQLTTAAAKRWRVPHLVIVPPFQAWVRASAKGGAWNFNPRLPHARVPDSPLRRWHPKLLRPRKFFEATGRCTAQSHNHIFKNPPTAVSLRVYQRQQTQTDPVARPSCRRTPFRPRLSRSPNLFPSTEALPPHLRPVGKITSSPRPNAIAEADRPVTALKSL